jgi:hypothetical protein
MENGPPLGERKPKKIGAEGEASQGSDVGSIPIARSITRDDPIGLTRPGALNLGSKTVVLVLRWS